MRIALDARWIFPEISGIGAYTRDLIRALAGIDRKNEYVLLFSDPAVRDRTIEETGVRNDANLSDRLLPYGVFSPLSQLRLPGILRSERIDVYHSTNYMIPLFAFPSRRKGRTRCVTTIHDVIPMIFPHHAPRSRKARVYPVYRRLMVEVGKRSDAVLTDSAASRRDVIKHLRIPPERSPSVHVIPCGVNERFRPGDETPPKTGDERRIIYVGRADPYKNVATLIRAFAAARARCPFPVRLLIAGSPDPRYPEAQQLAAELGIDGAMTWTGYLSDEQLVKVYQDADLLVHPSRYEGFGLQIAEAMACGVPVVCSNGGSLPEVAGDAAILLDPDDLDGFADGIERVLTDPGVAASLRARGQRQAAQFTWERTARETLAVYEEVASSPS
jgi:glycosyltransferase involved in cell wall biosynthesis